jgi:hypothetical protein
MNDGIKEPDGVNVISWNGGDVQNKFRKGFIYYKHDSPKTIG